MAMKKAKKRKPYDPLNPYGNHSAVWFEREAARKAQQDVNAQTAALPSAQFYSDSAGQLAKALAGIQQQQAGLASAGGGLYSQAFKDATAAANAAAGGQVQQTTGGQSLNQALGATMAQSLGGYQNAALSRGRNDVLDLAKQQAAIRAQLPSLRDKYLQGMQDDAMRAAVQRFNNQLAESQFGLQQDNTNFDNQLAAAQLDATAADRASKDASKRRQANSKRRQAKLKEVRGLFDSWTKTTNQPTGMFTYTYNVPGFGKFDVVAKDGPGALQQALAKVNAAIKPGSTPMTGTQLGTFLTGPGKAQTAPKSLRTRRDAYKRAVDILTHSGFTRAEAIRLMRQYVGLPTKGPISSGDI